MRSRFSMSNLDATCRQVRDKPGKGGQVFSMPQRAVVMAHLLRADGSRRSWAWTRVTPSGRDTTRSDAAFCSVTSSGLGAVHLDRQPSFEGGLGQLADEPAAPRQLELPASMRTYNPSRAPDLMSSLNAARAGDAARIARRSSNWLGHRMGTGRRRRSQAWSHHSHESHQTSIRVIVVPSQDQPRTQSI